MKVKLKKTMSGLVNGKAGDEVEIGDSANLNAFVLNAAKRGDLSPVKATQERKKAVAPKQADVDTPEGK